MVGSSGGGVSASKYSGSPLWWRISCRTVITFASMPSPRMRPGRYVSTGASRSILPSATSCMIVAATKVFVMLAVRTWVLGANPALVSTSAKPAAERVRSGPLRTTATPPARSLPTTMRVNAVSTAVGWA